MSYGFDMGFAQANSLQEAMAIIKALQDKQEYYAEDEFDDAHIAERATDILDNLAEIFGSDEQED